MDVVLGHTRRELRHRLELHDDGGLLDSASVLTGFSDTRGAVINLLNFDVSSYQGTGLSQVDLLDSLRMVRSQRA